MDYGKNSSVNIPESVLSSIVRGYSEDDGAQITKSVITPMATSGMSGNNSFWQAIINWNPSSPLNQLISRTLLIKRWTPGGISQSEIGWSKPIEALAWRHGLLSKEALPVGVKTPIVGAAIDPNNEVAWVAMTDVSKELGEFDRALPLPAERLIERTKTILGNLARFHAMWEKPEKQNLLASMAWLLPLQNYLWRMADFYRDILNADVARASSQPDLYKREEYLNLMAFMEQLDPQHQALLKSLLVDRSQLADRIADIPLTLLHGDLDDRNIGLSGSASGDDEIVLIDWEWMGCGPAAMDVAKLLIHASMMIAPGSNCPEYYWSDELPDHYYESYRLAGGSRLDQATWKRSYDLALLAQGVWPFPTTLGSIIRALRGEVPLPKIPGISEEVTRVLLASGLEDRKSMLDTIMSALGRCFRT